MKADPANPAMIHDLAEAAAFFAQAAVNTMPTAAMHHLADMIASRDASIQVRVTLDPFRAEVFVVANSGEQLVQVGCVSAVDDAEKRVQH